VLRGGIGIRAIGSASYGGKGYILIAFAVIGYFALSAMRIPASKAYLYVGLFFFGTVTSALSNFAYSAGESFWWLFYFLPVDLAISQAAADFGIGLFSRFGGVAWSMIGVYCFMLAKYGIRGILTFQHPFRFGLWLLTIVLSLLGGFRSILVLYVVLFWVQFYLEGLFRTRLFPLLALIGTLGFTMLIPFASRLPLVMQRTLSLLPLIDVDPVARVDAYASTDWRLRMWRAAWPQVGHYFILGKGFVIDPVEMTMVEEGWKRGFVEDYEASFVSGDYHSGPLSLLIPLGISGALTFIAFTVACLVVLYKNFRFGDPRLKSINTLLLSLFITRLFSFWIVFGSVTTGLAIFTGLIGLSVALNGGMAEEPQPSPSPTPA
jgi:O-antigen ligase